MSKKQLLAVGLIALSLVTSGVIYQRIQNKDSNVDLAEESFMEMDIVGKTTTEETVSVSQVATVQELITQVKAMQPQDLTVINALSAIQNLYVQKSQTIGRIGALNSQLNSYDLEIKTYMEVLQVWVAGQAVQ